MATDIKDLTTRVPDSTNWIATQNTAGVGGKMLATLDNICRVGATANRALTVSVGTGISIGLTVEQTTTSTGARMVIKNDTGDSVEYVTPQSTSSIAGWCYLNVPAGKGFRVDQGGSVRLLNILASGNVGIGNVLSPARTLVVGGDCGIKGDFAVEPDSGNPALTLGEASNTRFRMVYDIGANVIRIQTDNAGGVDTDRIRIKGEENATRVGIGGNETASCVLALTSTIGALLLPRMTTAERNALTPTNGMIIYNTTTGKVEGREGGAWVDI